MKECELEDPGPWDPGQDSGPWDPDKQAEMERPDEPEDAETDWSRWAEMNERAMRALEELHPAAQEKIWTRATPPDIQNMSAYIQSAAKSTWEEQGWRMQEEPQAWQDEAVQQAEYGQKEVPADPDGQQETT